MSILVVWALSVTALAVRERPLQMTEPPHRIISLVPAVTEMLFAIGAGSDVVAVSSFDDYPPQVRKLERVGALLDPDLERILALKPDIVVVYATQTDLQAQLARAGIGLFTYRHAGLEGVKRTIRDLGARTGLAEAAERVVKEIDRQLADVRARVQSRPRPRVLVVFGRDAGALRGIYASGGIGFVHEMVTAAGGDNVFADAKRESVQATTELILARKPDVILELRAGRRNAEEAAREIEAWRALPGVPAVKNGRVVLIEDPRTVVPGPRVGEGTELLARAMHPEVFR